jgi:uncharacterized protein (DUF697 family)/tellurite resistance protein
MNEHDREPIITIALMAALADGHASEAEKGALRAASYRLGTTAFDAIDARVAAGNLDLDTVVAQLSSAESRAIAYDTAVAACHADGPSTPAETGFLMRLAGALQLGREATRRVDEQAEALGVAVTNVATPASGAAVFGSPAPLSVPVPVAGSAPAATPGTAAAPGTLRNHDELIQQQAVLTAALELLPERLSTLAVLPLQGRMVYRIAQSYGHTLDSRQWMELAGAMGLGAAGQVVERTVSRLLGGLVKGVLGGMAGGATGLASAAAVTFAATYALGHAANQYYARGRTMSGEDLRTLFAKLQGDAQQLFPKLQGQVQQKASTVNLQQLIAQVKGGPTP